MIRRIRFSPRPKDIDSQLASLRSDAYVQAMITHLIR